jgi:hypothetical protein
MAVATQESGWGLCVMSLDGDGLLWCTTQDGTGGPWNTPQGPKFNGQPTPGTAVALANQGNGLLLLAMLDDQGKVWTLAQTAANAWAQEWTEPPIGSQIISFSSLAAATSYTYGLQLMATDEMGQIWTCFQLSPGGEWSGWVALGAGTQPFNAYELALADQNNNQLMLIAEGGGQLAACPQQGTGETWGPWSAANLNNQPVLIKGLCASQQGGARGMQLWGLDTTSDNAGSIWTLFQDTAGGQWDPWQGPGFQSQSEGYVEIAAALQNDGNCTLLAADETGNLYAVTQVSAGGAWGAWYLAVAAS